MSSTAIFSICSRNSERRSHVRYRIDVAVRWRALRGNKIGLGQLYDISSAGIRIMSSNLLAPGSEVEVSIDWPTLLNANCSLKLKIRGLVTRNDQRSMAASILRYTFCDTNRSAHLWGVSS
jgi:hypothetical protein